MADPQYSFTSPRQQLFAVPPDVIKSMLENPSSHIVLLKLYQTCKFFYSKRPILIARCVNIRMKPGEPGKQIPEIVIAGKDVSHLRTPIWPTNIMEFENYHDPQNRLPKFYRYSIRNLYLTDSGLRFDDFLLLISEKMVKRAFFMHKNEVISIIYHSSDRSTVHLDKLLQHLPNIQEFNYYFCRRTSLDMLTKLKFNHKLKFLQLRMDNIPSNFDFNLLCEFIAKNSNVYTDVRVINGILPEVPEKAMKRALRKLDFKWKEEAHAGLKEFFDQMNPKWRDNTFASPRRQEFSLPPKIISSMLENPSSHIGLMQLYQTCKYFYGKRPIIIADTVKFESTHDRRGERTPKITVAGKNVTRLRTPIWPTVALDFKEYHFKTHPLPKFVRCSVKKIFLFRSSLRFDDFLLLTADKTVTQCCAISYDRNLPAYICHSDGTKATIDELLEHLPNIQEFSYFIDKTCSFEMLKKLNGMKFNSKLKFFGIEILGIHSTFDMNLLCEFIVKNSNADAEIVITPQEASKKKLKLALQKLDYKWENVTNEGLKKFFETLTPEWKEELIESNLYHSFTSPRRQLFSFPQDVIRAMLENPSSHKGLMKLFQTCKYFYCKRPILITDHVWLYRGLYEHEVSQTFIVTKNVSHFKIPIWLTDFVFFEHYFEPDEPIPKFFRYSVQNIQFCNSILKFEDFILLASDGMVTSFMFSKNVEYCYIYRSDSKEANIFDLLQHLPNIQQFSYFIDEQCSAKMLTKLNALKFNHKFKFLKLQIRDLHSSFDINLFCEFITKNSDADTDVRFTCRVFAVEKLKLSLLKLDFKWKKEAHDRLKIVFQQLNPKWREHFFPGSQSQEFSLPPKIISSLLSNPSSHKGLLKLYQTCKYFYGKRPILIADDVKFETIYDEYENPITKMIFAEKDVTKLQTPIWLTGTVTFRNCYNETELSCKFYRYSIQSFYLLNSTLRFKDFVYFTAEHIVTQFSLSNQPEPTYICHSDGSKATIDVILQHLPNVQEFSYFIDEKCDHEMLTKLNGMKFKNKFKYFALKIRALDSTFDINLFCEFIIKNSNADAEILITLKAASVNKMKSALRKLAFKWKNVANDGLKKFFEALNLKWEEELIESEPTMSNDPYSFTLPRKQEFSLPPKLISAMLENPSSHKGLAKLYQTCKYFYDKRPILIASLMHVRMVRNEYEKHTRIFIDDNDVTFLRTPIWLTNYIYISKYFNRTQPLPTFFRSSVQSIELYISSLRFEDFLILTAAKTVVECNVSSEGRPTSAYICHSDGTKATIDELLEHLPNVQKFTYFIDKTCSFEILKKLNGMKFNQKFTHFKLEIRDIPPSFDMNLFCEFLVRNSNINTNILLWRKEGPKKKLQMALQKLDIKWKHVLNYSLNYIFEDLNPRWKEALVDTTVTNSAYSFASPKRQLFSLPPDVISAMLENPSSHKGLMKLFQTCKYFYSKRPILVADEVTVTTGPSYVNHETLIIAVAGMKVSHLQTPIWLTKNMDIVTYKYRNIEPQQPMHKFFRYSIQNIRFINSRMRYEDFVLLASESKISRFFSSQFLSTFFIYHPDGSKATIDEFLQHLPNIQKFWYYLDEQCSAEILKKLNALTFNHKFKFLEFKIYDIHPTFDMNLLCEFIAKNSDADSEILLYPWGELPERKLFTYFQKMDSKWMTEAHDGLKQLFQTLKLNQILM